MSQALFTAVDRFLRGLNDHFGQHATSYCRLETVDDQLDATLVADDGSLVSVARPVGLRELPSGEGFVRKVNAVTQSIAGQFRDAGHTLQIVFEFDPERSREQIDELHRPARAAAATMGLAVDDILDDWAHALSRRTNYETAYVVVWTRPSILPAAARKRARRASYRRAIALPQGEWAMDVAAACTELRHRHQSAVRGIWDALADAGVHVRHLTAREALREIRGVWDPGRTGRDWRAWLPGDPLPLRETESAPPKRDYSPVLWPRLAHQLVPRGVHNDGVRATVGERRHHPMLVHLPPQQVRPFNALFKRLLQRPIPWRLAIYIHGDGLGEVTGMRRFLAALLAKASYNNAAYDQAVSELQKRFQDGETVAAVSMAVDTWVHTAAPRAERVLDDRAAELTAALQSWGGIEAGEASGDPLPAAMATVPAMMPASPAPRAAAPLAELVTLWPLTRSASIWDHGTMPFRSVDGQLLPYQPGSAQQPAWVECAVAPMGAGKSVWMHSLSLAYLLQPGLPELPYLSCLDIGPSSRGLIETVRAALPEAKRHWAHYIRLRRSPEHAINPADTPLGLRMPLARHLTFLVNFLGLLCTPTDEDAPPEGVASIVREAIVAAYRELSDGQNPRPYQRGLDRAVDNAVAGHDIDTDAHTTYWEVVDHLFDAGDVHLATRAQRYAVPLLGDIATALRQSNIADKYDIRTPSGEALPAFCWRKINDAVTAYPVLGEVTRVDIGDARVVALDIEEVAPRGGPAADHETTVMYMLGRHVLAGRHDIDAEDLERFPERYRRWHRARIETFERLPVRQTYDEVHRFSRRDSAAAQLKTDLEVAARESRKQRIHLALYTQDIDDLDPLITEMATSVYVLGAGTRRGAERVAERLGLGEAAVDAIEAITQPGPGGAEALALWRTTRGRVVQRVVNTLGPITLWALSTSPDDVSLRARVDRRRGTDRARQALAERFPGGSAEREIERRKADADPTEDVIETLAEEVLEAAQAPQRARRA